VRRAFLALLAFLILAPAAGAAGTPSGPTSSGPVYDSRGHVISSPLAPPPRAPQLTEQRAQSAFLAYGKVARWLRHYPRKTWVKETTFDKKSNSWTVKVWSGPAGEVATGKVDDSTGSVTEAWTGPQVAWKMARGYSGAFGGRKINSLPVWLAFCAAFLIGLGDLRRPFSLRNLDLLVLLSFSVSLWYFNKGHVFTSVPLAYPPLVYLLGRMAWIGWRGRSPAAKPSVWPVWVLAAMTVFLMGFRVGLNVRDSNVIDVGYSGVIGAARIWAGESPYNHFPVEGNLKACGKADSDGEIRERIQTNGRCESANERGDTYGPVAYEAYLPGFWALGWTGKWDDLPAAHFTSIAFDVACLLLLALLGFRMGGTRMAATLAFAWAAYPFTQYVSSSNTNDAIPPAFLILGLILVAFPWARGGSLALSAWTKFGALLLVPLWASYPDGLTRPRSKLAFAAGFVGATALAFWVLFLEPSPLHAARVFYDRTVSWQIDRESPFSIWDWRQYHAGLPDLHLLQRVLEVLLLVGAVAVYFLPRRKTVLQLAALTGALLIGFELVLTHWFYLYIPWFFPFVAVAVLAARPRPPAPEPPDPLDSETRDLVPTG
jgi:hypothetical protein